MSASGRKMISLVNSFLCLLILTTALTNETERPPSIGIVGAGIGGTSVAHFMRELFGADAVIDIFEKGNIGGRLATVNINGKEYEAGGAIIHPANYYMVNFTSMLGVEKKQGDSGILGIFNGEEMVVKTSSYTAITLAKLFWRYGLDIYNIQKWVRNDLLNSFNKIYDIQRAGYAYTSVQDLLSAMDPKFVDYMSKSIHKVLKDDGFSDRFIDEFVLGAMRTNYGQSTDIHGFVGAVSLAGVESGLWSVKGGNKKVPEKLVTHSKANLIKGDVKVVEQLEDEDYQFEIHYDSSKSEEKSKHYDLVVIATPLHDDVSDIKFEGFQSNIKNFPQKFHKTVATFVLGKRNASYFHECSESCDELPDAILTCNKDLFLNSLGQHSPVDLSKPSYTENVVGKIFSNKVPRESDINRYYKAREDTRIIPWMAYPEYNFNPNDIPTFLLSEKLYYVNAIELAASAMEMSALAGKNVALLAYHHWHDHLDKIDEPYNDPSKAGDKSEL